MDASGLHFQWLSLRALWMAEFDVVKDDDIRVSCWTGILEFGNLGAHSLERSGRERKVGAIEIPWDGQVLAILSRYELLSIQIVVNLLYN
jgi:hypothetical protein